jgi:signal transduction histidine kinase/DNA-binding response OmpR family regulator
MTEAAAAESKVHILIVDDQPANLLTLETILESLGQHLVKAGSGPDALRCVLHDDFAVVLLDVQMAGMDGFETAKLIRSRERSRHTPIIFLTAYDSPEFTANQAYALGAVDYLIKPIVPEILRAKVMGFVELFRKAEQVKRQAEQLRDLERREFERRLAEERQQWELGRLREEAARAEASRKRAAFLAEASAVLASSLDYQATLDRLARLAVPALADWCVVDMWADDGTIRQLAVAHPDPAKVALAWDLDRRYPDNPQAAEGVPKVLRSGQPELYTEISDDLLRAVARNGEHLEIVRRLGLVSGMIVPLIAHGRPLGALSFGTAESARRFGPDDLALAEDLARRAALAVDNARLYREAQEANRLKDEFLATLSHELRTPLSGVLGWTHILRGGKSDEAMRTRGLEIIERSAKAQVRLIEDILDVSRIITGKLCLEMRPVELVPVIDAALEAVRPAADAKSIALEAHLEPPDRSVSGDPNRLQQVVWNLLSNAIKFTPRGGRVDIRLIEHAGQAEVTVSDTGQGIKPEFLPYVFERFRQADSSTTRVHGGLGLGLAIVRHLVELHGGSVHVESAGEGQGATFRVRLPVQAGPLAGREGREPAPAPPPVAAQAAALANRRVLVVDDEPGTREFLGLVFRQCGSAVTTAASVPEALVAFERDRPDVLVSDIGMPGEDGYTLIDRVRALPPDRGGQTPALALTAYARDTDRARVFAAGFQAYLAKPVVPDQLIAAVADLVAG